MDGAAAAESRCNALGAVAVSIGFADEVNPSEYNYLLKSFLIYSAIRSPGRVEFLVEFVG